MCVCVCAALSRKAQTFPPEREERWLTEYMLHSYYLYRVGLYTIIIYSSSVRNSGMSSR